MQTVVCTIQWLWTNVSQAYIAAATPVLLNSSHRWIKAFTASLCCSCPLTWNKEAKTRRRIHLSFSSKKQNAEGKKTPLPFLVKYQDQHIIKAFPVGTTSIKWKIKPAWPPYPTDFLLLSAARIPYNSQCYQCCNVNISTWQYRIGSNSAYCLWLFNNMANFSSHQKRASRSISQ